MVNIGGSSEFNRNNRFKLFGIISLKIPIYIYIMAQIQELERHKIQLQDIKLATNNFSKDNLIGKGGFGNVYKGQLPHSTSSGEPSTTVAVKRFDEMMIFGQGQREFLTEIVMLCSNKHENLVSLVGYSDEDHEKILVYKHEVNGSLDTHLATTDLTWEQRLRICLGAARGLDFLHSGVGTGHRVLHRDIKSSNILLDGNWEAKISDFGLSKIGLKNQEFTFLVTNAVGTFGYTDPLYLETGVFTKESDVFSFGVVMLEVLCGRLALIEKYEYHDVRNCLYKLAKLRYEERKLDEIIFAGLLEQMKPYSLQTFSRIAYQCLDKDWKNRPTMELIIQELTISLEFQIGCPKVIRTELFGSIKGGDPWSLQLDINQKLTKITIDHKDWVYSIGFTTQDTITGHLISSQHGGTGDLSGGELTEINIDDDEEIIEIMGTAGKTDLPHGDLKVISSLCIMTSKKRHGPFGQETGTRFSVPWNVGFFAGFYGRAGYYLDGLGFYSKITT